MLKLKGGKVIFSTSIILSISISSLLNSLRSYEGFFFKNVRIIVVFSAPCFSPVLLLGFRGSRNLTKVIPSFLSFLTNISMNAG
jgi:hypothetical protein